MGFTCWDILKLRFSCTWHKIFHKEQRLIIRIKVFI